MVELIGPDRFDQADVVDDLCQMRQDFRQLGSRLAVAREPEPGAECGGIRADERIPLAANDFRRDGAALEFGQLRLVVEPGRADWGLPP